MTGDLVDGAIDQLTSRLGRLATLGSHETIVGVRSVHHIDHAGREVIVAFINDLLRTAGPCKPSTQLADLKASHEPAATRLLVVCMCALRMILRSSMAQDA